MQCSQKLVTLVTSSSPKENILIEYQGEQHYKPIKLFGGKKQLEIQRKHDKIKREFANNYKIKLYDYKRKKSLKTRTFCKL